MDMSFNNFNPFDIDFSAPAEAFLKSGGLLMVGTGLETVQSAHLPPIIIETAKVLAYLGASVAFFRFVMAIFSGAKDEK
jgi:hypothetical protein